MPKTLKERFDHDDDFHAYIEKFPELLTSVQKITTKCLLIKASGSRHLIPPQPGQIIHKSRSVGVIKSTFVRNPDKIAQVVSSRTSSLILADIPHPPLANEPSRDVEEENLEEINWVIDNLFSDYPEDSPP